MYITKTDPITGEENTLDLDVTAEQLKAWQEGALIQDVMGHLSADDREFLISGMTPESFDKITKSAGG
jgi:hypothetical protein